MRSDFTIPLCRIRNQIYSKFSTHTSPADFPFPDPQFHHRSVMEASGLLPPSGQIVHLVLGGSGFIGSHIAQALVRGGQNHVVVSDSSPSPSHGHHPHSTGTEFVPADLRSPEACERVFGYATELCRASSSSLWVWLLAADMGGMGYLEANSDTVIRNNAAITLNVMQACVKAGAARVFMASSACVYPESLQMDGSTGTITTNTSTTHPVGVMGLREDMAWPARPQDGYGLEKLFGEEVAKYAAQGSLKGGLQVRIARFHNIYGPHGTWMGGREKAPAAFVRKALFLQALDGASSTSTSTSTSTTSTTSTSNASATPLRPLEVWGNGKQVRSFCYIDDAVEGVLRLMCSPDVHEPLNIGSEEAVTVTELALLAGEAAGLDREQLSQRLSYDATGPIGVDGRNSDNTKATALLGGWAPRVRLADGLKKTAAWIREEMEVLAATMSKDEYASFLEAGLHSSHVKGMDAKARLRHSAPLRFALLVPVTSRFRGREVVDTLRSFLVSLRETTAAAEDDNAQEHGARSWRFDILFGVDKGDAVCDQSLPGSVDLRALVREVMPLPCTLGSVTVDVRTFSYPPGHICSIWADMAAHAFFSGSDYTVLLGDDILLKSKGWADAIYEEFEAISKATSLPFGFGCVAFADEEFPGFPTFPVLHRTHMQVFNGMVFPTASFINQDADPFLFQIYRAFGASRLLPKARLHNLIGGAGDARYKKAHMPWTGAVLSSARNTAAQWLHLRRQSGELRRSGLALATTKSKVLLPPPSATSTSGLGITLDVVVPTYRTPLEVLESIISLPVPAGVTTQFTIICDRPGNPDSDAVLAQLQHNHRDNPFVRIRSNICNLGAGPSRNRGLAESAADWVLFLDDDTVPDRDILAAYKERILAHPRATGFIGLSVLDAPTNARQAGVHMAGVAFFWGAAKAFADRTDLPWGVTANLCVRRVPGSAVLFDTTDSFPRSGGGEDIDYCLRLREWARENVPNSEGLVAAPRAVIRHPWWDGGRPAYSHFSGWAQGDGHLIDLYPQLTYRNLPDLTETLVGLAGIGMVQAATAGILARMKGNEEHLLSRVAAAAATKLSSRQALSATALVAAGCVVADVAMDLYIQLIEKPSIECQHLSLWTRVGGVLEGIVIRTCSEAGRMVGHFLRGRLLANTCRRFNWFGYMWDGAPAVERKEAVRRMMVRALFAGAALRWILPRVG